MKLDELYQLAQLLPPWYALNARELPWRQDKEPYHVWLSEIMLQQTRVEAVKPYYARFLAQLPTIRDLANAPYEQVQKLWEGLGYYSRARNLQAAAQIIVEKHEGRFPQTYEQIRALPGIGDYTAGAISSICFSFPTPAVDGNVLRVISRLCMLDECVDEPKVKKRITEALAEVYPLAEPGILTQSLMELGATVCLPNGAPKCENCPMAEQCSARIQACITAYPVRKKKKERRQEEMTVFILRCDGCIALRRRPNKGLLAGLWEFPHVSGQLELPDALKQVRSFGCEPKELESEREKGHIFTHIEWKMRGYYLQVSEKSNAFTWITEEELKENYALPTAFRQFLE